MVVFRLPWYTDSMERRISALKKRLICYFLLLCFLLSGCGAANSESREDAVRLLCLNIGKADCMLLLYRDSAYLIDAGYEQTWPALQTALAQYSVTKLNGVFLTHCHEDHQGGLMPLAESDVAVDAWYAARIFYDQKESKHPAKLAAAQRGQEVVWLDAGMEIAVGDDGRFTVLGPLTVNTDNENNNSLVLRFDSPESSILLTGDMKEDEEFELLDAGLLSPCDLLKVGHHGDNNATSKALLEAVRPKAAVILTSTAEEPDTPAESPLRRLDRIGCAVYVSQEARDALLFTLQDGEISVEDVSWQGVPERAEGIRLAIDTARDTVTIFNENASPLPLNGFALYSTKGNELMELPDGTLQPGGQYVIGTDESTVSIDARWRKKRVWNLANTDIGILYDAYGRPIAVADNGIQD